MPEIAVRVAPAPGTAAPGNLYVDLQSRTLWLGVNTSVDPDQAVLISDIDGTLTLIAEVLQDANAYTDQQVAPKANLNSPAFTGNPTLVTPPTAGDNDSSVATTGFVKAAVDVLVGAQFAPGMLMMWGGWPADIGVGSLANWALCNGAAVSRTAYPTLWQMLGTMHGVGDGSTTFNLPDLRERFIMGAGTRSPGLKNASNATTVADTSVDGSHGHDIQGTALLPQHLPAHTHGVGTLDGTGSGNTDPEVALAHGATTYTVAGAINGAHFAAGGPTAAGTAYVANTPAHSHTVSVTDLTLTGSTGIQPGTLSQAHDHETIDNGAHSHTVSALELREALPFYTVCYIIRLK